MLVVSPFSSYGLWTPAEITTALWLDAADSSTVTESSGLVSQWDDKSGNTNNAVPISSGFLYENQGVKNSGIETPALYFSVNSVNLKSIFLAYEIDTYKNYGVLFSKFNNEGGFHSDQNSRRWYLTPIPHKRYINGTGIANNITTEIEPPLTTKETGINIGTFVFTDFFALQTLMGITAQTANLFGSIYEFVGFDSELDDLMCAKIEGYLAHKWGLTANLPVTHPYKNTPPYVY